MAIGLLGQNASIHYCLQVTAVNLPGAAGHSITVVLEGAVTRNVAVRAFVMQPRLIGACFCRLSWFHKAGHQERLVTELRLAMIVNIEHANEVLHRYLPGFDDHLGVPAAQSEVAYRRSPSAAAVEQALCFRFHRKVARDNTVRHRRRTLKLMSGMERTSNAGAQVEVLECPDGRLLVEYQRGLIAT